MSDNKTFDTRYDCERWIQDSGFKPYFMVKQIRIYRKISGMVNTEFARAIYKDCKYCPEYGFWPEERVIVKVADTTYKEHSMEIIEFLQNHPDGVAPGGGIIEPNIFSSTILDNNSEERYTIFTFLNKNFATEFKLIWG